MSRIRTVKPEYWTSEQVVSCSQNARLLFIGLWNFCDDSGVHPASLVRLKAEIFPCDNCSLKDMKVWVNELIQNELLYEYQVDGKKYWIVTGWKNHQRIDKPTYRHPTPKQITYTPPGCSQDLKESSPIIRRNLDEDSSNTLRVLDEPSMTEWNGMESKGKEINIGEVETSPVSVSKLNSALASTQEIFQYWQSVMNHPKAKLDKRRQSKINSALKAGYEISELKQAIDGCYKTPYNMGKNDSRQVYDDITLILRDAEHIERFMNNALNPPTELKKACDTYVDIMAGVI
jgi:hypothetical protein